MKIRRYRKLPLKIFGIFMILITTLAITGYSYSQWHEEIYITGKVETGNWKSCIQIRKTLSGSYTNPENGAIIDKPTNLIAITADFPTKFKLTIEVKNCKSTELTNVIVTDTIKNNLAPRTWMTNKGTVKWENYAPGHKPWDGIHFGFNELTWTIGTLDPGEEAYLEILIETLQNRMGKYVPTSEDKEDGEELEINEGATVTAESTFSNLSATTVGITLTIIDDDTPKNGIGKIESPQLPYSTPWAEARYP